MCIDADARDYEGLQSDFFETVGRVHWGVDVAFHEDESRIRQRQAAGNFTVLRHIALARLKNEKTLKRASRPSG